MYVGVSHAGGSLNLDIAVSPVISSACEVSHPEGYLIAGIAAVPSRYCKVTLVKPS